MIPLHQIQIAKPCPADWNAMMGDTQTRFCPYCKKTVHALSQMTTAQAQALLDRTSLNVCVRIARTADGRIVTRDATFTLKKMGCKTRGPIHQAKPRTKSQTLTGHITLGHIILLSQVPATPSLHKVVTGNSVLSIRTMGKIVALHR